MGYSEFAAVAGIVGIVGSMGVHQGMKAYKVAQADLTEVGLIYSEPSTGRSNSLNEEREYESLSELLDTLGVDTRELERQEQNGQLSFELLLKQAERADISDFDSSIRLANALTSFARDTGLASSREGYNGGSFIPAQFGGRSGYIVLDSTGEYVLGSVGDSWAVDCYGSPLGSEASNPVSVLQILEQRGKPEVDLDAPGCVAAPYVLLAKQLEGPLRVDSVNLAIMGLTNSRYQ